MTVNTLASLVAAIAVSPNADNISRATNMATSNYALRLQSCLKTEAEKLAAAEGRTLNQFINVAVAEKIAAFKTLDYLRARASCSSAAEALGNLDQIGRHGPLQSGDKVST